MNKKKVDENHKNLKKFNDFLKFYYEKNRIFLTYFTNNFKDKIDVFICLKLFFRISN